MNTNPDLHGSRPGADSAETPEYDANILVVDDEPELSRALSKLLGRNGYHVLTAGNGEEGLAILRREEIHLVLSDLQMPKMGGLDLLKAAQVVAPNTEFVIITGHGTIETAVDAMRAGAYDFIEKPFSITTTLKVVRKALEKQHLIAENRDLRKRLAEIQGVNEIIGNSEPMRNAIDTARQVAASSATILLTGESGTGKEVFATAIHGWSDRNKRTMVRVSCAALPENLLEAELFGYEKGAFTGAVARRKGRFEMANNGTLFLDEVGEMSLTTQVKLLRVLQENVIERLGGNEPIHVDVRIIAATNSDLPSMVTEGRFREDLFYRLNVVTIRIPPLRERPDEIAGLTDHFLCLYAKEYGKEHKLASDELRVTFAAYRWPGNVRELENLVKRMVVLGSEAPVLQELAARSAKLPTRGPSTGSSAVSELERFLKGDLERVSLKKIGREAAQAAERRLIERVLQLTRWNRREAAEILQISYKALLYKMKDAGLADRA
jgi:DNA-binding NtrC family response regulator